jgi:hypothetical protein
MTADALWPDPASGIRPPPAWFVTMLIRWQMDIENPMR